MRKFGKHVALLMAVVMVLTMVPAMPISAAESQSTAISSISVLNTSNFALNSSTPAGVRTFSAQFGTIYNQGDLVEYNGRIYEVLQTFTFYGDPLWHPGIAPSLWRFVGTGVGSGTNPPIGGRDFIPRFGEIFIMGEIIRYNGRLYEVLQTFRFYGDPLWHPGIAPSLWRFVGLCTGGTNGGNNGGENGNDDPDPMLTILTDYIVTVFVDGNEFPLNTAVSVAAGSQIDFIIIPDRGSRLYSAVANRGELVQINQFAYSFTMPSSNARISLSFQTLVPMPDPLFPAERRSPIMTVRGFTENNIMTSAVYDDFRFIRGEILIYARWSVQYHEMEELARSFGGEIVGFLEVPNVFQVYFHGRSELQLWHLIEVFNNRNDITLAVLNSVFEMAESPEAEPEPEPLALGIATLFGEDDAIGLRPNDPFFNGQHGLQSINAPRAWAILEAHRDPENSTPVNIGIMDTLFEPHEDMSNLTIIQDLRRFCTRNCTEDEECTLSCVAVTYDWHRDHGLRVASVIGADSNNNRGMAGVAWYSRLYGFALSATPSTITEVIPVSTTLATYQYGLTRLFYHGVQAVNVSMFTHSPTTATRYFTLSRQHRDRRDALETFLAAQLNANQEFLIMQIAGNHSHFLGRPWVNAGYSCFFTNIGVGMEAYRDRVCTCVCACANGPEYDCINHANCRQAIEAAHERYRMSQEIRNRIIVVGNMSREYRVYNSSQIGNRVDIMAPGERILSAIRNNGYNDATGTSVAAPHVTGVAGMIWYINPYLRGDEVKQIILDSAIVDVPNVARSTAVNGDNREFLPRLNAERAVIYAIERSDAEARERATIRGIVQLYGNSRTNLEDYVQIRVFCATYGMEIFLMDDDGDEQPIRTQHVDGRNEFSISLWHGYYLLRIEMPGMISETREVDLNGATRPEIIVMHSGRDITVRVSDGMVARNITTPPFPFIHPSPFLEESRLLIPIRAVVEGLGYYTYWHGEERLITVHGDGFIIEMEVDEPYYTIVLSDGTRSARTSFIDNIGPMIIDGRAFLPLRSLAENLGYTAEWNNDSALAILTSGTGRRSF